MIRILAVYYTQTGQQKEILENVLFHIKESSEIEIDYLELQTVRKFPYPWGSEFFDCFPESVKGIPASLEPLAVNLAKDYDLVFIGCQPWYLSPCIPVSSFLQSEEAKVLLKNRKVITVVGSRNMWVQSQEIIKGYLKKNNAKLTGNIVLRDRSDNYIAGITVINWLMYGKKGPTRLLPEAGVSAQDIKHSRIFGAIILESLKSNDLGNLQKKLIEHNAVPIKYHLVNIEKNARKIFDIFANYVLRKGSVGERKRRVRVKQFKVYLLFVFFILSPIFSLIFMLKRWILFTRANNEIKYLQSINYRNKD